MQAIISDRQFLILDALRDGRSYGWEIASKFPYYFNRKKIAVYSTLKRLEQNGLVSSTISHSATRGGFRRYYQLTENGQAALNQDPRRKESKAKVLERIKNQKRRTKK